MTITDALASSSAAEQATPHPNPASTNPASTTPTRLTDLPEGTSTMTITIDPKPPSLTATEQIGTPVALNTTNLGTIAVEETAVEETAVGSPEFATTDFGLPMPTAETWWTAAACREVPNAGELFFSEELQDIAAAKRVCAECPAIAPCLEGAITRGEPWGVWGGQLFLNGKILARKRRRGRPPKNPRPEDQIPDIPVPEHLQKLIA